MPNYKKIKPTQTAIPTQYGWADPKTGELLVAIKGGCDGPVEGFKLSTPWTEPKKQAKKDKKPKEVVEPVVEIVPEIVQPTVVEPVKEEIVIPVDIKDVPAFTEKDAVEPIVSEVTPE